MKTLLNILFLLWLFPFSEVLIAQVPSEPALTYDSLSNEGELEALIQKGIALSEKSEKAAQDSALAILSQANFTLKESGKDSLHAEVHFFLANTFEKAGAKDSALHYFQLAQVYYERGTDTSRIYQILGKKASIKSQNKGPEEGIQELSEALEKYKDGLSIEQLYKGKLFLGHLYHSKGETEKAQQLYLEVIKYGESIQDSSILCKVYMYLAELYSQQKLFESSLTYFHLGLAAAKASKEASQIAEASYRLGTYYVFVEQNFDTARVLFNESLNIGKGQNFVFLHMNHYGLGELESFLGNFDKAAYHFKQAQEGAEKRGRVSESYNMMMSLVCAQMNMDALDEARSYVNRLEKAKDLRSSLWTNNRLFHTLAIFYEDAEEWDKAAENWRLKSENQAEIFEKESQQLQDELFAKYEAEKKDKQLIVQRAENQRLESVNELNKLRLSIAVMVLMLAAVGGGLGFVVYQQKMRRRELIKEQEKVLIQSELESKQRELTAQALNLAAKGRLLDSLKGSIEELKEGTENKAPLRSLIGTIDQAQRNEADWNVFEQYFREVHGAYEEKLKLAFENLTSNERRLIMLMKMDLSTKEIAEILHISPQSVNKARYRLRKKLRQDTELGLQEFVQQL